MINYEYVTDYETSEYPTGICQLVTDESHLGNISKDDYINNIEIQDKACENYAITRYGSWENAYYFHLANGWW